MIVTAVLSRIWPYLLGGAAVIALWLYADHRGYQRAADRYTAEITRLQAGIREQTAAARADDIAHARVIEQAQEAARKEAYHDIDEKLAAARADADAYVRRVLTKAGTDQGGGGRADMPGAPDPAGKPAGTGEAAFLDDTRICAENTVKAEGWSAWWASIQNINRGH